MAKEAASAQYEKGQLYQLDLAQLQADPNQMFANDGGVV